MIDLLRVGQRIHWSRAGRRHWPFFLLPLASGLAALLPGVARADVCGISDPSACIDVAQYNVWYGAASVLWLINRSLLQSAYQLDWVHWWLVNQAFTSVYQVLVTTIQPGLVPFATLALMLAAVTFALLPITGPLKLVDARSAVLWTICGPALLVASGPWLMQVEAARMNLGNALFTAGAGITVGSPFGVVSNEMPSTERSIYAGGNNDCGTLLYRPSTLPTSGPSQPSTPVEMDDLAAAMMYADVSDIHCPEKRQPSPDIPDRFYSNVPGWAVEGGVGNITDSGTRQTWITALERGTARLGQGLFVSFLAVMNNLVQLLFGFALVVLWLALPIALLFVFFHQTSNAVSTLAWQVVAVLRAGWIAALLLGILFTLAKGAAGLGNATAFTGIAVGGILLTLYLVIEAGRTLLQTLQSVSQTLANVTGLSGTGLTLTGNLVGQSLRGTGHEAMALASGASTYVAARRAGAGRSYALGTVVGRNRMLARVGDFAAGMGYDSDLSDGLLTGRRSAHSPDGLRSVRRFTHTDVTRKEQATEQPRRGPATSADGGGTPPPPPGGSRGPTPPVPPPGSAGDPPSRAHGTPEPPAPEVRVTVVDRPATDLRALTDALVLALTPLLGYRPPLLVAPAVGEVEQHPMMVEERAREARMLPAPRLPLPVPEPVLGPSPVPSMFPPVRVLLAADGTLELVPPLPAEEVPAWALDTPPDQVDLPRLLQWGSQVQPGPDGTLTHWHPAGPTPHAPHTARNDLAEASTTASPSAPVEVAANLPARPVEDVVTPGPASEPQSVIEGRVLVRTEQRMTMLTATAVEVPAPAANVAVPGQALLRDGGLRSSRADEAPPVPTVLERSLPETDGADRSIDQPIPLFPAATGVTEALPELATVLPPLASPPAEDWLPTPFQAHQRESTAGLRASLKARREAAHRTLAHAEYRVALMEEGLLAGDGTRAAEELTAALTAVATLDARLARPTLSLRPGLRVIRTTPERVQAHHHQHVSQRAALADAVDTGRASIPGVPAEPAVPLPQVLTGEAHTGGTVPLLPAFHTADPDMLIPDEREELPLPHPPPTSPREEVVRRRVQAGHSDERITRRGRPKSEAGTPRRRKQQP